MENRDMEKRNLLMAIPLGLSEKELLIYMELYKKCDFETFVVKYDAVRMSKEIKIIRMSPSVIRKNIKKMIDKGLIENLTPSLYRLVIEDKGVLEDIERGIING